MPAAADYIRMTAAPPKILVVLPSPLMARNFLRSDALQILRRDLDAIVTVVSPHPDDRLTVEQLGGTWLPYFHPRRSREPGDGGVLKTLARLTRYGRYLAGLFVHMCLTYRINVISDLQGFKTRLRQSWSQRKIYLREGLPMSQLFGIPFARSRTIYDVLYRVYYSRWQRFAAVDRLLAQSRPDLMILSMLQTHMVTPYALAARARGVRILGINGSWDQPTTKGPVCPGVERIAVQNDIVRGELVRYHQIPDARMTTTGWLQMDAFARDETMPRTELLAQLGIPATHRFILFAANAPRLGPHEPDVFRRLAELTAAGEFGDDVVLLCRCHPQDRAWETRWGWVRGMHNVVLEAPELGPLNHLAALIRHAGVVVASAGSINLDAVALDTPTIGLAWEDASLPHEDRHARAYELEHLSELRTSPGMTVVSDMPALLAACKRYLADKSTDSAGRADLRNRYLYRLDGQAATRLTDMAKEMLA
ncbi:hypothetical protein [Herbaspirillum sp. NPDC101396]|uniref:hypothetical protein n=1 Tax=Herbaspirillum sp. NPDC101396 TaxID=3364005 RepID=UPI003839D06D